LEDEMSHGLDTYVFIDQDDKIMEECDFGDEEAAEKHCERLMRRKNMIVGCYKEIVICDPVNYPRKEGG
jgi:hypothetical protein